MATTFDVEFLISELELDREDILELLQDFRDYIEEDFPKLKAAIESENIKESRSLAHALKGSAGNLRINAIYKIAMAMQDAGDNNDPALLKELLVSMEEQVKLFLEESSEL